MAALGGELLLKLDAAALGVQDVVFDRLALVDAGDPLAGVVLGGLAGVGRVDDDPVLELADPLPGRADPLPGGPVLALALQDAVDDVVVQADRGKAPGGQVLDDAGRDRAGVTIRTER